MDKTAYDDLPASAQRILAELDKLSEAELLKWVTEAVQSTSQRDRQAITFVKKRSWAEIETEITERILSWDYEQIRGLREMLLALGDADKAYEQASLQMMNMVAKNPKLEAYIFYRCFGGKPRIRTGLLTKV